MPVRAMRGRSATWILPCVCSSLSWSARSLPEGTPSRSCRPDRRLPSGWAGFSQDANASVAAALTTEPAHPRAGKTTTLHFSITEGGAPVEDLTVHHGRKLHVVLISEDMQVFGHIHPEDFDEPIADGEASVRFTFPRAGRYLAAADLATAAGTHAEHYTVDVEGDPDVATSAGREASVAVVRTEDEDSYTAPVILDAPRTTEGYELSLARPRTISAGTPATFVWRLIKDGEPVTDLQLYLAAPMHIAMVKEDLSHFVHGHGTARGLGTGYDHAHGAGAAEDSSAQSGSVGQFGPEIAATFTFPESGRYYLFGQAAHGENLLISRVPVDVR